MVKSQVKFYSKTLASPISLRIMRISFGAMPWSKPAQRGVVVD